MENVNQKLLSALENIVNSVLGSGEFKRKADSDGYYNEPLHEDEVNAAIIAIKNAKKFQQKD